MIVQQFLSLFASPGLYQSTLEASILLLLPALGGVISERSGVTNIAMEGMMLMGAFVAVVYDLQWHNPWLATLVAIIAGGLLALLHAIVSIRFKADQIISGFAINVFAAGLTAYMNRRVFGTLGAGRIDSDVALPFVRVPALDKIPVIGFFSQVFIDQNVVVYLAVVILIGLQVLLFRTRLGLRIRAVGEHPQAADTAGINVYLIRYGCVVASGVLSALAGAFLSLSIVGTFNTNMTGGRGFIALAAMIFGRWTPIGAFIGCLIFGLGTAVFSGATSFMTQSNSFLLNMLPYILTLIVLAWFVGRSVAPAADGIPYEPGGE